MEFLAHATKHYLQLGAQGRKFLVGQLLQGRPSLVAIATREWRKEGRLIVAIARIVVVGVVVVIVACLRAANLHISH
jgi:hypothetical protein